MGRARQKLAEMHASEAERYVDPMTFAGIHASLGEFDEAVRRYPPDMVFVRVARRITPQLAHTAGYQAIVDRMAFPNPTR